MNKYAALRMLIEALFTKLKNFGQLYISIYRGIVKENTVYLC